MDRNATLARILGGGIKHFEHYEMVFKCLMHVKMVFRYNFLRFVSKLTNEVVMNMAIKILDENQSFGRKILMETLPSHQPRPWPLGRSKKWPNTSF